MKYIVAVISLLVVSATGICAETMYITDVREISFRTGPGMSHKLIKWLPSGQQIEMVKKGEGWSHVRLPAGQNGWVLTRFLSDAKPNRLKLLYLEKKHALVREEIDALSRENERLKAENEQIQKEYQETKTQFTALKASHETLKAESADFLNLQALYAKSKVEMETHKEKADTLEVKYDKLYKSKMVKGGIAGALILLVGLFIGSRSRSKRRRYTY